MNERMNEMKIRMRENFERLEEISIPRLFHQLLGGRNQIGV